MEFLHLVLPDPVSDDLLPAQHVVVVDHLALFLLVVTFFKSRDKATNKAMAGSNTTRAEVVEARGEDEGLAQHLPQPVAALHSQPHMSSQGRE